MKAQISAVHAETSSVKLITLVPLDEPTFPPYEAGAHINLTLPSGLVRQYSLCNQSPGTDSPTHYRLAVKREQDSRGGSAEVHALDVGATVDISAPLNLFPLSDEANFHIFVAAGIGITPLFAMCAQLHERRNFSLLYFARSREEAALVGELESLFPNELSCFFDDSNPPSVTSAVSRALNDQLDKAARPPEPTSIEGTHFYVCGPQGFMNSVIEVAQTRLPTSNIHFERFQPSAQALMGDESHRALTVEYNGETFEVSPSQTIAEVLQENDVPLLTSCEDGICGTCVMRVLDGTPDHRDSFLTQQDHADGLFTPCVSRAQSPRLSLARRKRGSR